RALAGLRTRASADAHHGPGGFPPGFVRSRIRPGAGPGGSFMQALTLEGLRSLASRRRPPCLSLYLSTHRGRMPDDRARLEGLARRARELLDGKLSGGTLSRPEVGDLLDP